LPQRFRVLKKKSITYVQNQLFSGFKLTSLGEYYSVLAYPLILSLRCDFS
jgi:hypothetical protein